MKAYHDILRQVLDEGTISEDRTGVGTTRTTGAMFKHNMQDGFPLMTTKKVNPNTVFAELEFFIKGITDKKWLRDRNCNIWNEWCNPEKVPYGHDVETKNRMRDERDLGEVYGYLWNHWDIDEEIIEIEPKLITVESNVTYPLFDMQSSQDTIFSGRVFDSINYGKYIVLKLDNTTKGKSYFSIQFLLTGYVKHNVRLDVIQKGNVKDLYYPNIHGVGFIGNIDTSLHLNKK